MPNFNWGPPTEAIALVTVARAVVVAQLAERSLPIPEDPGSNTVIGNF